MNKIGTITVSAIILALGISAKVSADGLEDFNDYANADGTYSYYFNQGITVTMSEEWYQNTFVKAEAGQASFYHKDSYEKYMEEGIADGGKLFTVAYSVNSGFKDLEEMTYIGFDEEEMLNYFTTKPTDYPAYVSDSAVKAEYDSLWNTSDEVIGSIRILSAEEADTEESIADVPECVSPEEIEIKPSFCEFEKKEQMQSVIYRLEAELTNHSEQEVMEIRYQFRFFDHAGTEMFSGQGRYNGQDMPVQPGETVISEQSGRIELEKEPASWKFQVLEVCSSEEIPPIHLPQEGELLAEALSDVHFENITEEHPVKIEIWIDRMGDLSEAAITDEETIEKVTDAFSKIRIGKQTYEVVTDNYNGLRFCFEDGTETVISLNYRNLEYPVYHGYRYHELENFEAFWQLMTELTS